jgi:hypothetical protein
LLVFLELKSLQRVLRLQTDMTWVKGHYEGPGSHIKYELNKITHKEALDFLKGPCLKLGSAAQPISLPFIKLATQWSP